MSLTWCGVDPGKKGAIAFVTADGEVSAHKIPVVGKEYNDAAIVEILASRPVRGLVLEHIGVIPGAGKSSNIQLGIGMGLLWGIAAGLKIPVMKVRPYLWQKEMWVGVDKVKKSNGRVDTKGTSLIACRRLFPRATLMSARAKKADDNIVDAILLAEFCRRTMK